MNTFSRANEALQHDLAAYAQTLYGIVNDLPRALALCDAVAKETRLAQALLAFASGPQINELGQIVFQLSNLWPYREETFARTSGFRPEIEEAQRLRAEAERAGKLLARHSNDGLAGELMICFEHIADHLTNEQKLLEECHARIHPHTANMDITRKRLQLLSAALDARAPISVQQQTALQAYNEAIALLRDWESGVPLDERGLDVLDRCLALLKATDHMLLASLGQPV